MHTWLKFEQREECDEARLGAAETYAEVEDFDEKFVLLHFIIWDLLQVTGCVRLIWLAPQVHTSLIFNLFIFPHASGGPERDDGLANGTFGSVDFGAVEEVPAAANVVE